MFMCTPETVVPIAVLAWNTDAPPLSNRDMDALIQQYKKHSEIRITDVEVDV
jgi:hypothetical protein